MSYVKYIADHWESIAAILALIGSEAIAAHPGIEANSWFQLFMGLVKKKPLP